MINIQHRLWGGPHRIAWSAEQILRICDHYKVDPRKVSMVERRVNAPQVPPPTTEEAQDSSNKNYSFTISTPVVDRGGDTIAVSGWKTAGYFRNPVVLFGHDSRSLPVGKSTNVWVAGNRLKATARFAPNGMGAHVREMIENGFLKAASVGFRPIKFEFSHDPQRKYGIDFLEQELLEWSVVPVPANAEATLDPGQIGKTEHERRERERRNLKMRRTLEVLKLRAGPP